MTSHAIRRQIQADSVAMIGFLLSYAERLLAAGNESGAVHNLLVARRLARYSKNWGWLLVISGRMRAIGRRADGHRINVVTASCKPQPDGGSRAKGDGQ